MIKAEIGRKLVEDNPNLLSEAPRSQLMAAITATYERDHGITVTLSEEEIALARMVVTRKEDLPSS